MPSFLRDSTEICVSMVDMKSAPRCTTKIYSRHYQRLCLKYVCLFDTRPETVLPERSICQFSGGSSNLGIFFFLGPLDFVDSGAIYRLSKDGARERAEGRIRIRRKRHYHFVVSLVSWLPREKGPFFCLRPPCA
jgi:hypothetical protein